MPSDAWTEQETQLLKRAVRAVPSDLEKNDRWRQVAVLVGGGRGKKECYEYWKALNKTKAAPVIRRPPSPKKPEPARRPKAQTDRVKQRKAREEVLVVDIDDSPQRDEGKEDDYSEDAFEDDISQQLERSAIGAATWRRDVGPGATLVHRRADARADS